MADVVLSQPAAVNLVIYRGDTGRFRVTVSDPDGAPLDVSSAAWLAQVRAAPGASPMLTELDVEPVAGETSKVDVVLTETASEALVASGVWDLQMTLAGEVVTLLAGTVQVTPDVSREGVALAATSAVAPGPVRMAPELASSRA